MQGKELTGNQLKTIAIIAMLLDHIAWLFLPTQSIWGQLLHAFGRTTAPIMCFFIAEGYRYTSNRKKYLGRLLLFAAISHFPYVLCFQYAWYAKTSVFWSLAMGLVALWIIKHEKIADGWKIAGFLLCCLLAYPGDWSYRPVLWIVAFGLLKGDFKKQMLAFAAIALITYVLPSGILQNTTGYLYTLGIFLVIPLLWLYRGKRGSNQSWQKWIFYIFYPLHLFLLYFLRIFLYNMAN